MWGWSLGAAKCKHAKLAAWLKHRRRMENLRGRDSRPLTKPNEGACLTLPRLTLPGLYPG